MLKPDSPDQNVSGEPPHPLSGGELEMDPSLTESTPEPVAVGWVQGVTAWGMGVWQNLGQRWRNLGVAGGLRLPGRLPELPGLALPEAIASWFTVSEAQMAEILASVRSQLPTTEVVLIGKTQAGKSSIVRGLTGVSAAIVGQGFRPHTQHTQRYAYPSADLPLLSFTDTVGLGDIARATGAIAQELSETLSQHQDRAQVVILTVKVTDFATASVREVLASLRRDSIPCLLAISSLHELYPADLQNHPPYPPELPELDRAVTQIQRDFAGLWGRCVVLDFTLEEDGYTPVFYGLEALRDALAELLPEAESRTIYQLLDGEALIQLGGLYRDVGRRYSLAFALAAAAAAAVPLPFATMPVLTALQVSLVGALGKLYGQTISPAQAGGIVSAIAGGFVAQAIGRELMKLIPGLGSAIAASWAAAYTWALGEAACVYFGDIMGGKKPDPQRIQTAMQDAFREARDRFSSLEQYWSSSRHDE